MESKISASPQPQPPRKLIVCCDGTWNERDSADAATNVAKMARALRPTDDAGRSQLIYYHPGIGTGNKFDRIVGGAFGIGLSANVQSAYAFLADNYQRGDTLYLFGFSRGAYTVRSLAGLIGLVGLLRKRDMDVFPKVYHIYRSREHRQALVRGKPTERQRALDALFPGETETHKKLQKALERRRPTRIFFIGVWDTVGSLGVPAGPLRSLGKSRYEFHDTELSEAVQHAYHALAIDEYRGPFKPTLWTRKKGRSADPEARPQILEQVWFAGCHSNIGGGYPDCGLSDLSFLWMASKAASAAQDSDERPLAFDEDYLRDKIVGGKGALINSAENLLWKLQPKHVREILADPPRNKKGEEQETCERIHESVVLRFRNDKPGSFTPHPYVPQNAKRFLEAGDSTILAELSAFEKSYAPKDVLPP